MARPKKSNGEAEARQRIQEAFWELLENNQLREITVGTVTSLAKCNRGTFYYHFQNLDDLIYHAIEEELGGSGAIAKRIFLINVGEGYQHIRDMSKKELHRICLILSRGGLDMVLPKTIAINEEIWHPVLCPNGERLTPETRAVIAYTVGGILTLLVQWDSSGAQANAELVEHQDNLARFIEETSRFSIGRLETAQGIDRDTITMRLASMGHYINSANLEPATNEPAL